MATKPRGGGLKALVAGPLKKELFLRLPLFTIFSLSGSNSYTFRVDYPDPKDDFCDIAGVWSQGLTLSYHIVNKTITLHPIYYSRYFSRNGLYVYSPPRRILEVSSEIIFPIMCAGLDWRSLICPNQIQKIKNFKDFFLMEIQFLKPNEIQLFADDIFLHA